jgi:G3E family GTPase
VAQTFFVDDVLRSQLRLDAIVTVVDARHVIQHLDEQKPSGTENEAVEQIAFADRVILNKCDLVTSAEADEVVTRIRAINAGVMILPATYGDVDLQRILGVRAFDLDAVLAGDPQFLLDTDHQHDSTVTSVGIEADGEVDVERLNLWLGNLLSSRGVDLFRSKGILNLAGTDQRYVFQGVHMLHDGQLGAPWREDEDRTNRMVFIGRNLDRVALEGEFRACLSNAATA